ncbi:class II fructose-bisphosphate aldolase, partial [Campylobacter jejuni]
MKLATRAGFTSVMIDGASYDFEENIAFTKKAVDFAKGYGIPVEAELGAILGKEDDHVSEADSKTDPSQVKEFVERTGCDMLAISVGNVHGLEDEPRIDFDLLKEINEVSPVPLFIHGGSGIPDEHIQRMVEFNITKINIASDLLKIYIKNVGQAYEENKNEANLIKVLQ